MNLNIRNYINTSYTNKVKKCFSSFPFAEVECNSWSRTSYLSPSDSQCISTSEDNLTTSLHPYIKMIILHPFIVAEKALFIHNTAGRCILMRNAGQLLFEIYANSTSI